MLPEIFFYVRHCYDVHWWKNIKYNYKTKRYTRVCILASTLIRSSLRHLAFDAGGDIIIKVRLRASVIMCGVHNII